MATTKTESDGHFEISGSEDEITDIDPKLNIYHGLLEFLFSGPLYSRV